MRQFGISSSTARTAGFALVVPESRRQDGLAFGIDFTDWLLIGSSHCHQAGSQSSCSTANPNAHLHIFPSAASQRICGGIIFHSLSLDVRVRANCTALSADAMSKLTDESAPSVRPPRLGN